MADTLGVIVAILAVVLPLALAGWLLGREAGRPKLPRREARRAKMPR